MAGQSAANQVYSTCAMVTSTIPTLTLTLTVAVALAPTSTLFLSPR